MDPSGLNHVVVALRVRVQQVRQGVVFQRIVDELQSVVTEIAVVNYVDKAA